MPIIAFLRAAQRKLDADRESRQEHKAEAEPTNQQQQQQRDNHREHADGTTEQPLDCTKTRELCAEDDPEQLIEVVCDDDEDDDDNGVDSDDDDDDDEGERRDVAPKSEMIEHLQNDDRSKDTSKSTTNLNHSAAINEPLPKFKITRLNSRRGFITTTAANSSNTTVVSNGARNELPCSQASPIPPKESDENGKVTAAGNGAVDVIVNTATGNDIRLSVTASATDKTRPLRKRKRIVDGDYSRYRDDGGSGGERTKPSGSGGCVGASK